MVQIVTSSSRRKNTVRKNHIFKVSKDRAFEAIDFSLVKTAASSFADHIESHLEELTDILLEYESFEVVQDEIERTLDVLRHLNENKQYFAMRVGAVTSFLPRNQPLYALTCFVIIPSLMANEVHFRIPHSMRYFFPRLLRALKLNEYFPNIVVSTKERLKFLKERSALRINPKTEESWPFTDAVIFTGTSQHAEALRLVFDRRTLFIANGSGHNPVIISEDADITKATQAVLSLSLYNQGQDCAGPNSILVHKHSFEPFLRLLHQELKLVKVGQYRDRSCRVGPISEPEDLTRIQALLVDNRQWLDPSTPGILRTNEAIVEPTIVCKPLESGGNFSEVFAPIIFIQQYNSDQDLAQYFEHPSYSRNAMYITVYGASKYVDNLTKHPIGGKVLHDKTTILHDTHLHAPGIERGTQPYGGFGYAASSYSIQGSIICKPTLPQREIYEYIAKPLMSSKKALERKSALGRMTKTVTKDVSKILGMKKLESRSSEQESNSRISYLDTLDIVASDQKRYIEFPPERIFKLLTHPNIEYMTNMEPRHIHYIRALRKLLRSRRPIKTDKFEHLLYAIPKRPGSQSKEQRAEQLSFFRDVYQLLLGKDYGPRLAQFLLDADRKTILDLLDA